MPSIQSSNTLYTVLPQVQSTPRVCGSTLLILHDVLGGCSRITVTYEFHIENRKFIRNSDLHFLRTLNFVSFDAAESKLDRKPGLLPEQFVVIVIGQL